MIAEEILAESQAVYARCTSYTDNGYVETNYQLPGGYAHSDKWPFKTAFVRPDRFKFEFCRNCPNRTEYRRYLITTTGSLIQTWWDVKPGVIQSETLSRALAGPTGISRGSAIRIPRLLMPDKFSPMGKWVDVELARLDDIEFEGSRCFRIERRYRIEAAAHPLQDEATRLLGCIPSLSQRPPEVLWFDQSSFLIRRVEDRSRISNLTSQSVTTYEPTINETVPEELLRFDPPTLQPN